MPLSSDPALAGTLGDKQELTRPTQVRVSSGRVEPHLEPAPCAGSLCLPLDWTCIHSAVPSLRTRRVLLLYAAPRRNDRRNRAARLTLSHGPSQSLRQKLPSAHVLAISCLRALFAPVAQLDRVLLSEGRGRTFESC